MFFPSRNFRGFKNCKQICKHGTPVIGANSDTPIGPCDTLTGLSDTFASDPCNWDPVIDADIESPIGPCYTLTGLSDRDPFESDPCNWDPVDGNFVHGTPVNETRL